MMGAYRRLNAKAYAWAVEKSATRGALVLLGIWSFLESSIWFIYPDFLLSILALCAPKRWKDFLITAALASMAGTLAYIGFIKLYPDLAVRMAAHTPFVQGWMVERVSGLLNEGIHTVFYQPWLIVPAKVWTMIAVFMGMPLLLYVVLLAVSRSLRMAVMAFCGFIIGTRFRSIVQRHFIALIILYATITISIIILLEG